MCIMRIFIECGKGIVLWCKTMVAKEYLEAIRPSNPTELNVLFLAN